jgi:hypothetical protein
MLNYQRMFIDQMKIKMRNSLNLSLIPRRLRVRVAQALGSGWNGFAPGHQYFHSLARLAKPAHYPIIMAVYSRRELHRDRYYLPAARPGKCIPFSFDPRRERLDCREIQKYVSDIIARFNFPALSRSERR